MRYCPQCNLPEDLMGDCGRHAFGPEFLCPEPAELPDDQMLRVECAPCAKAFAFPASGAMKGSRAQTTCQLGTCAAKFVLPQPAPAKGKKAQVPPPLSPDMADPATAPKADQASESDAPPLKDSQAGETA
jgi:hypothetical protein